MLSDFTIIEKKFPNREDIKLVGIFDLHIGAREHLEREWNDFLATVKKDENTYFVLGGDLMNNATRSSVSNIFEETMRPREQKRLIAEMMEPLRDRIVVILPGNHENRSGKDADDDPLYDVACKLDLEDIYRENIAFLKLKFGSETSDGVHNPSYMVVVHHGAGGGQLSGSMVNRAERFIGSIDGADLFMIGHSHLPFVTIPEKLKIDPVHNIVTKRSTKIMSMSSWLDYGGYAARKMLSPRSHVLEEAYIRGKRKEITISIT